MGGIGKKEVGSRRKGRGRGREGEYRNIQGLMICKERGGITIGTEAVEDIFGK